MTTTFYILVFIFGAIVGSFLNVVIYRMRTGLRVTGRSMCFTCGQKLRWYELFPLVSFIAQKGRCRTCGSKISWQYPTVELITATLFVLSAYYILPAQYFLATQYEIISTAYLLVVMSILVVISVYDIRHKIIPDSCAYILAAITLSFFVYSTGVSNVFNPLYILDLFAGPILAAPFAILWLVSKGRWMGLGDAKLMLGLGWLLGLYSGISAVILAFWIGAVAGILLILIKGKSFTMKTEIPFGPFLVLGTLLVIFGGIDVLRLVM
ncbi:prepilin peptidase [Patescibacteria group bacterium]